MGATTVAGTMIAARMAGIDVFVTGGLGGVHRDGHVTMDISADITELGLQHEIMARSLPIPLSLDPGRTGVAVVCAGVKSILDIERTLEQLETYGVPVITYGTTADFPAFFTPK